MELVLMKVREQFPAELVVSTGYFCYSTHLTSVAGVRISFDILFSADGYGNTIKDFNFNSIFSLALSFLL